MSEEQIPESFYQSLIDIKDKEIAELKKQLEMIEKLNDLNIAACHEIADQRDRYYDALEQLKNNKQGCCGCSCNV